jgi:hypothetical protein
MTKALNNYEAQVYDNFVNNLEVTELSRDNETSNFRFTCPYYGIQFDYCIQHKPVTPRQCEHPNVVCEDKPGAIPWCQDCNAVVDYPKTRIMTKIFDSVNHPKHYTQHPSGIECIEITRHMNFNLGNCIKYLWRTDHKNGLEDLKKARWYLEDEIKRREK